MPSTDLTGPELALAVAKTLKLGETGFREPTIVNMLTDGPTCFYSELLDPPHPTMGKFNVVEFDPINNGADTWRAFDWLCERARGSISVVKIGPALWGCEDSTWDVAYNQPSIHAYEEGETKAEAICRAVVAVGGNDD